MGDLFHVVCLNPYFYRGASGFGRNQPQEDCDLSEALRSH
jgi:hypothetical protein